MYPDPAGPQVGDPIVNFLLSDRRGDMHAPRTPGIAGRLSLIVLLGDPDDPTTVAEIEACRVHAAGYAECGCALVAICQAASDRLPDVDGFIMLEFLFGIM